MAAVTKRYAVVLCALLLFAVPLAAVFVEGLRVPTIEQRAHNWVVALPLDERVSLAKSPLGHLPLAYRKALLVSLTSSEHRVTFWQARIDHYLNEAGPVSPEVADYLAEMRAFIASTSGRPDPVKNSDHKANLTRLEAKGLQVLGRDAFARLFVEAGSSGSARKIIEPLTPWNRIAAWASSKLVVQASSANCSCSQQSDWCNSGGQICVTSGCNASSWEQYWCGGSQEWCEDWNFSCGTFLQYPCNGDCGYPLPPS